MTRPFRFGVLLMEEITSASEFSERCRRLEDSQYDVLLLSDHLDRSPIGPLSGLAAAAGCTEDIRLGTLVLNNDLRHPAVLAKELISLDLLSSGRLEIGIGAGWMDSDYTRSGISKDPGAVRVARLEEAVAVLKRALTRDDDGVLSGAFYSVQGPPGPPRSVQAPHPPLLLGGSGPRMLALAGREADIVSLNWDLRDGVVTARTVATSTGSELHRRLAWVREAAVGRRPQPELGLTIFFGRVTDAATSAARQLAEMWGVDVEPSDVLAHPHALIGSVAAVAEELQRRREEWGVSYIVVYDSVAADFAPVVQQLSGR